MLNMENQSEQMKTQVETFFQEEVLNLLYDNENLEEWKSITESLGLSGQVILAQPNKSPIPFMHLKQNIMNVFLTLCPREVEYRNFNITPIPLEILRLIQLSVNEDFFTRISIRWDDKSPDPVVIGERKLFGKPSNYRFRTKEQAEKELGQEISSWSYETNYYLIGKWGDVKESFEVLVEKAKSRWIKEQRARFEQQISDAEMELVKVISNADQRFEI
jgi:hypothetical protein